MPEEQMKHSVKYLATIAIGFALTLAVCQISFNTQYKEGLGVVALGTSMYLWLASLAAAIFSFILLLVFTLVERKHSSLGRTLFKFFFSFVFLALTSTWLLWAEPGYMRYANGFLARVDRECEENEVRSWALAFIANNRTTEEQRGEVTNTNNIPDFIKRIYPFQGSSLNHEFRWMINYHNGIETLNIYWGGALAGHWGLEIGPTELDLSSDQSAYYLKWKPGIYIWYETQ